MNDLQRSQKRFCWYHPVTVLLIFLSFLLYSCVRNVTMLYWDAYEYWHIADDVFAYHNLYSFPAWFRGYLYPCLVVVARKAGNLLFHSEWMGFWIFHSALSAITLGVSIPCLFELDLRSFSSNVKLLLASAVALFFWGDIQLNPNTDFPPLAFQLAGAALLHFMSGQSPSRLWKRLLAALAAGLCFYAAYNGRVTYLYGFVILFVWFMVRMWKQHRRRILPLLCLMIAGAALLSIPQTLLNGHHFGQYTPRLLTESYSYDSYSSLEATHLHWGMTESRAEGYFSQDRPGEEPTGQIIYLDPVGVELLHRTGLIDQTRFTFVEWLKAWLNYPFDMLTIYVRHVVNALTPFYNENVVRELYLPKWPFVVFQCALLCLAALGMYTACEKKKLRCYLPQMLMVAGITLPGVMHLVGAVEMRFVISVHLLLYFYVICAIDYRALLQLFKRHWLLIVSLCLGFFLLWTTLVSNILQTKIPGDPQLLNDTPRTYEQTIENKP